MIRGVTGSLTQAGKKTTKREAWGRGEREGGSVGTTQWSRGGGSPGAGTAFLVQVGSLTVRGLGVGVVRAACGRDHGLSRRGLGVGVVRTACGRGHWAGWVWPRLSGRGHRAAASEWFLLVHKQGGPCRWQVLELTLEQEHAWSQGSRLFLRATHEDLVYGAAP